MPATNTWTDDDLVRLIDLCRAGRLTVPQIARELGRSMGGVKKKMAQHGLTGNRHRATFWNAERLAELRALWSQQRPEAIARHFGVTVAAVCTQATHLGLRRHVDTFRTKPKHCRTCFIAADYMAGCPRKGCAHYAAPAAPVERTMAGVSW